MYNQVLFLNMLVQQAQLNIGMVRIGIMLEIKHLGLVKIQILH